MRKSMLVVLLLVASITPARAADWAIAMESPQAGGITAFAAKSDGTFYACEANGNSSTSGWTATSHGKPGLGATGDASGHYHSTNTDLYVFTRTLSGNLYLRTAPNVFNNSNPSWSWVNLGKPSTASIASDPVSVSYGGKEYAFVVGSDSRLHVVYGAPWVWSDQGTPAGVTLIGRPSTLAFDGKLYVFIVGSDGLLYTRYWNGSAWSWVSLGAPPSGTVLEGSTAAVTRNNTIHVFVRGADDHVYIRYWSGASWQWSDQGAAPNGIGAPEAAWFGGATGPDLYAFALRYVPAGDFGQSLTPRLLENHWNGAAGWELESHGQPAQSMLFRQPSIAGSFTGASNEPWPSWRVSVFVRATGDRIYRRLYAPINNIWQWSWPIQYCQM